LSGLDTRKNSRICRAVEIKSDEQNAENDHSLRIERLEIATSREKPGRKERKKSRKLTDLSSGKK